MILRVLMELEASLLRIAAQDMAHDELKAVSNQSFDRFKDAMKRRPNLVSFLEEAPIQERSGGSLMLLSNLLVTYCMP